MRYRRYKAICAGKGCINKFIQTDSSINKKIIRVAKWVAYKCMQRICIDCPELLLYINCYGVRVFAWMFGEALSGEAPRVPSYADASVRPIRTVVAGFVGLAGFGGIDRQALHSGSYVATKVIYGELSR